MASGDARQKAMDVNRSLRTIKTELEKLLELGAFTDDDFNSIHDLLPQEWSLRGGPSAAAKQPMQQQQQPPQQQQQQRPPLPMRNNSHQSAASHTTASAAPTPAAESEAGGYETGGPPAIGYASAKYKYDSPNDGDLAFERGDTIAVYSIVNDDWWQGRNVRSGSVGIFPRQYIKPDAALAELERASQPRSASSGAALPASADADRQAHNGSAPPSYYDQYGHAPPQHQQQQQQQQQQQYGGDAKYGQPYYSGQAPPPQQQGYGQQPYYGAGASNEQQYQQQAAPQQGNDKMQNAGKKIGGKLGNAFVTGVGFAAGAELVGAIL